MGLASHRPHVFKHGRFWFWTCSCSRMGYGTAWSRVVYWAHRHVEERMP